MTDSELSEFFKEIHYDYEDYINSVSTPMMASSYECAKLLVNLCENSLPKCVVDFGSGFSSLVLRRYKLRCGYELEVFSVDADKDWLNKTEQFITSKNIECTNLFSIKEFVAINHGTFDVILYDMAYYQNGSRQQWIPFVINECSHNNTQIIFDDVHVSHYFMFILEYLTTTCSFNLFNTRPITSDQFGRYAMLVTDLQILR